MSWASVAADEPGDIEVPGIVELGDDVVGLGPAARMIGHREHRLDDVGIGVVGLGREDDDRARGLEPGDVEVVDIHRDAGPADDRGLAGLAEARPDVVVHVALVAVGEDHDGGLRQVRVRRDQLRDDREDLLRPAEDDGVARLDDARTALAQRGELALEPGVDDADERADDEDPEQGDREHPDEESERALVAAHRARVERPHQAVPEQVRQGSVAAEQDGDDDRDDDHADRRHDEQAEDQGDRAARHEVVEGVPEALGAGWLVHAYLKGDSGARRTRLRVAERRRTPPADPRHAGRGRRVTGTTRSTLLHVEAPGSSPGGFFVSGTSVRSRPAPVRRPGAEGRSAGSRRPVVLDVDRPVEPGDRRETSLGAVIRGRGHGHGLLRGRSVLEAADGQPLAPGQAERRGRVAGRELERQDAHPDEVRAVDPFVALGQDHPHAEQRRSLGRPVARRPGAVLAAGDDRGPDPFVGVAHRRVEDEPFLAVGQVDRVRAFLPLDQPVAQADVGERAADHHLVMAAPRAVRVELERRDPVLLEPLAGRRRRGRSSRRARCGRS